MGTESCAFEAAMMRCVELGKEAALSGNYGLGALVVRDGVVLSQSGSGLIAGSDPTAHPEIVAIRTAAEQVGSRYLPGAYLVTTLEPCPMCTAAAIWAKMGGIVYGASQPDAVSWAGAHPDDTFTWRQIGVRARDIVRAGHPVIELHEGVCREDCLDLFRLTGPSQAAGSPDESRTTVRSASPASSQ